MISCRESSRGNTVDVTETQLRSESYLRIVNRKRAVNNSNRSKKKATPGPRADRLKLKGNWKDLVKKSLSNKKPADGWPK